MRDGADCVLFSADKTKFVGSFKQGVKHGAGNVYGPDGTQKWIEKWIDGYLENHSKIPSPKQQLLNTNQNSNFNTRNKK